MTYGKLPKWQQGDDNWLLTSLAEWLGSRSWPADVAARILTGEDPEQPRDGKDPDRPRYAEVHLMDGRFISLKGSECELAFLRRLDRDQALIKAEARRLNLTHAHPDEWLSLAETVGIVPVWIKLAIDHGLCTQKQEDASATASVPSPRRGIIKGTVISLFGGMHFDKDKWAKYLGDPPRWLEECRVARGNKRVSATWNPVLIASALIDKGVARKKLDAVFVRLPDWADEWREVSASFPD